MFRYVSVVISLILLSVKFHEANGQGESCYTPNNSDGVCVVFHQCPSLLQFYEQNQRNRYSYRYLVRSQRNCGTRSIGRNPLVCCNDPVSYNEPPIGPTRPDVYPPEIITTTPRIVQPNQLQGRLLTPDDNYCISRSPPIFSIVGGKSTTPGKYPWIALLGYTNNVGETNWKCGGSLITTRHVLTAAHCIKSTLTTVRLGEHDISLTTDGTVQDIRVIRTLRHPQYDARDGNSDLAILYLEQDANISPEGVRPICLPIDESVRSRSFVGFRPTVAGWGRLQEGGKTSDVLQELDIPVLDNAVCRDRFQKQGKLISEKQFDDAVLCAGVLTGGQDSCQGDSGGPLMQRINKNNEYYYYQIGIVSYGIGCARTEVPGVYTRVQRFVDWIQQNIYQ